MDCLKKVPRCVHHVWWQGRDKMPKKYEPNLEKWKEFHPDWEFRFWDQTLITQLAKLHFPEWVPYLADNSPLRLIERCDVGRCIVLACVGGVYSDLDYRPCKSHGPLLELLDKHPTADCAMPREMYRHVNCWIAAKQGSRFLSEYYLPLVKRRVFIDWSILKSLTRFFSPMETLWKTGPEAIEDSRRSSRESSDLFLSFSRAVVLHEFGEHAMDASWFAHFDQGQRDMTNRICDNYEATEDVFVGMRRQYVSMSKTEPYSRFAISSAIGTLTGLLVDVQNVGHVVIGALVILLINTYDRFFFAVERVPRNRLPAIVPLTIGFVGGLAIQTIIVKSTS